MSGLEDDVSDTRDKRTIASAAKYWREKGETSSKPHEKLQPSRYTAVDVLFTRWLSDNLGVISEITKFDELLKTEFNFTTEHCVLPDRDPEQFLNNKLYDFKKGKGGSDRLLILYYAGHGGGDISECIWAAHNRKDVPSPMLNFHNVKNVLLGHHIDVLIILDCCQSTLAVNNVGVCENWFLGASSKESNAKGVGYSSFTSTLIRVLERKADRYWAHNEWFTVGSIHSDLVHRETELEFTPFLVSLNAREASHTELTPLLPKPPKPARITSMQQPKTSSFGPPQIYENVFGTINPRRGLDCIYVNPNSPENHAKVDVVFVHDYRGHAIESFACFNGFPPRKVMWPSDKLPRMLEDSLIAARIMTYGWDSEVWLKADGDTEKACNGLIHALDSERREDSERPIVFVGHGVGGLLIKDVIRETINSGFRKRRFKNPFMACFFLSVPHRGLTGAEDFADVLANIKCMFEGTEADSKSISSLKLLNNRIAALSREFDDIRNENSISAISFYEQQRTSVRTVVPEASAILDHKPGRHYPINANHCTISQLPESCQGLELVLKVMRETICSKLGLTLHLPTHLKQSPADAAQHVLAGPLRSDASVPHVSKEKVFSNLKKYDTVFLVDDSGSMAGPRWRTTSRVLKDITKIAVDYDKNGVDIYFFNEPLDDGEGKDVKDPNEIMRIFDNVTPDGSTPTARALDQLLSEYVWALEQNRNKKGLNLIVLTDGQPDPGEKVEETIVKYANELKALRMSSTKVGIQFVQIGADEEARLFLQSLDDDLKEKHGLDRDVSPDNSLCEKRANVIIDG